MSDSDLDSREQSRTIRLEGEIGEGPEGSFENISRVVDRFLELREEESNLPINLLIASPGGNASTALMVMAVITSVQKKGIPVYGYVMGHTQSAAAVILQVCDRRYIYRPGYIMLHGAGLQSYSDCNDLKRDYEWMETLKKKIVDLILVNSPCCEEYWNKIMSDSTPTYYWEEEALEVGLVDAIL